MLFDPDADRSIEEVVMRKWNKEWDAELKAEILQIAHALNCSWMDVVIACVQAEVEELEDPITRQRLIRDLDQREAPFGKDPPAG